MTTTQTEHIYPVEKASMLDTTFRRLFQNPSSILKPYISDGMTVLDLGCGSGFIAIDLAKKLHKTGKVIAADLQTGMLDLLKDKITGTPFEDCIVLHQCKKDAIELDEKVDFVLAFYMIHEVPDQQKLFKELKTILKPDGKALIIEPKVHVTKRAFNNMISTAEKSGFTALDRPRIFFSRAVVLSNN